MKRVLALQKKRRNIELSEESPIFVEKKAKGGVAKVPYIPKGKLHRYKHNISEAKAGTRLSKNGIPVVGDHCSGDFCIRLQTAEIEADEIIIPANMVGQLEKLIKSYNKNKSDDTAKKIGEKLRVFLSKTEDSTNKFEKAIKKIKR